MTYKLFIDDERFPPDGEWVIARSSAEAIAIINAAGMPSFISFDHDLGGDDTARRFIVWLTDQIVDEHLTLPPGFSFYVHSQNPIGAEWIRGTMDGLIYHFG